MQISAEKIWNSAQEHLRVKLSRDTFNMWFAPLRPCVVEGQQLTMEAPNEFCEVWLKDNYLSLLQDAVAVAAGCRLQVKFKVANASPLAVGRLVGAHNGDVDAAPLRARFGLTAPEGETDSEAIYQALAAAGGLAARLDVLAALVGRAALAWADRARPGRVHLARAALSPLTVAVDSERNVYWASCPQWLRVAERETPVRFVTKALLAEGTYLAIEQGPRPRLVTRERFVPVARQRDRWHESAVWRGFTRADREKARALQRHVLATTRPGMVAGRVA